MKKKSKGGISGTLISIVSTLIAIGVVLAAFQLSEVKSLDEAWNLAKEKSKEYSECIPNNTCGVVPILNETINKDGDFNLELGSDKETCLTEERCFEEPVENGAKTPDDKDDEITLEETLIKEKTGYKGPADDEPFVTKSGSITKESAETSLKELKVVEKEKDVDYNRTEWKHWIPYKGNSCWNVREEVLKRDAVPGTINLISKSKDPVTSEKEACAIGIVSKSEGSTKIETNGSGQWIDPYSGDLIEDSSKIDIDHIIPLSKAAKSGGQSWNKEKKEKFANDLENLLATSAKENRSKGDKGPGEYMPPNKDYRCQYAKSYISIAHKYSLTINKKDSKVLNKTIKECSI